MTKWQKSASPIPATAPDYAVERLRSLGVFPDTAKNPNSVRENAEIFERSATIDAIRQEMRVNGWALGGTQFVYFHLEALLERDSKFKSKFLEEAKTGFSGLGISAEHIEEFFQCGADPDFVFTLRHERQYNKETRAPFYEKADQFSLERIRQWLGYA